MDARSIIATLRDGEVPSADALTWFATGLASGEVTDAQAGAFAMAAVLKGLGDEGRVALTIAMRDSGDVLAWDLPGPILDKHSTGGVGDCVSLLLAPMLAACGAFVPMISGRGLGHTGGTLDKLESIPGVSTNVDEERFRTIVGDVGCAIVSATGDIAPADRRLYAVRDVTATVESVDLITASILSKKLAAGLEALILDVKVGSGAFMATAQDARALARALVDTANGAECRTAALITEMGQPLARSAGNALEVADCMDILASRAMDDPLEVLTIELVAELLIMGGLSSDLDSARRSAGDSLSSGAAMERFERMIAALGGPRNFGANWRNHLPRAAVQMQVAAPRTGMVAAIDTRALGEAVVHLGGGRLKDGAAIDPSVGLENCAGVGDRVEASTPLAIVHAASEDAARAAIDAVLAAYTLTDGPVDRPPLIHERLT